MADLITLADYKALIGILPANTKDDARTSALITASSRMVEKFTSRSFQPAAAPTSRTFQYDGSGMLEVDDFTNLLTISTDGGFPQGGQTYTLDPSEYTAMPYREQLSDDPSYYIILHSMPGSYSPEMGFERNMDTMDIPARPVLVTVTATWGWPEVPEDIKLAVAWTVQDSMNKASSSDLQSESIAGYSRTWQAAAANNMMSVPNRARDILQNYIRMF